MIFFDAFGNSNIEKFSENPQSESKPDNKSDQIRKMLEEGAVIKPLDSSRDYLALVGNIATSGIMKAKDFIKEDGSSIKEVTLIPKNLKVSDGELEVNGKFTTNGEFIVKTGDKVVHSVDKEGNLNVQGSLLVNKNIKANKSMIGNDPNGFVELRGGTPYIDFSHHETQGDFDNRIILQNKELSVTGNMNIRGKLNTPLVQVGNHNIPHPDNADGAIYRADGQVQIATDDLVRVRHIGTKQTGIQLDARPGTGDMSNPNGQMKITRQGIMFGGPNGAGKEGNSAQISAGRHVANSLNIVGMSSNNNAGTRRVDVWSENGMHVRSNQGLKVHGHGRETSYGSVNNGWSHMSTTAPQFFMNKPLQVNGGVSSYHNKPLHMPHGANIINRTTINDQATHIPLVVQSKHDSHVQLLAHNKPAESVYLINRNGGHFRLHSHGVGDTLHVNRDGHTFINSRNNNTPLHLQTTQDAHIRLTAHNKPAESVYLINRNGGHFRVHSHGVGDTLHVNRDGHTFINSRGNHIPLHVQSANDAHIRITGRNNGNLSTYLINRNGGNFMVHQHGVGDAFQVLRDGRVRINHNTAHLPNADNYSMEIFTPQQDRVKETSLRFHQGGRYWHQLRADNTGFKMTTGNSGALSNLQVNSLISRNGVSLMLDTRKQNLVPSAYRARGKAIGGGIKIDEFKENSAIQLPTGYGSYCYLVTIVPWADTSGGTVKQIAYTDHSIFYRTGTADDAKWNNWRLNNETIIR
jgi:hypothetical protein